METELLRMLEDVGYKGPLLEPDKFSKALELGAKSTDYTSLVAWFTEQIATFTDIDEIVHPTHSPDDASSFLLELSCFLKEMGCMNHNLTTGNVNQRLADKGNRTLLLEILASELMACKLLQVKDPEVNKTLELTINESDTAKYLKNMLIALNFQKPPDNITPQMLFNRIETKLKEIISKVPSELVGKPLFYGELSASQWEKLDELNKELHSEYEVRREMLLTRLDVTIQSFLWSDRVKAQENEINTRYHAGRGKLGTKPNVGVADLLAARADLAIIEKTSSASVRKNTKSSVNKVIIGAVPDRGGRPYEQEPPPPEMPPWQKDRVAGPSSSRGGGRGGGSNTGGGSGRGGYGGGGGGGYSRGGGGGESYGGSRRGGGEGYGGSGRGGSGYGADGGYGGGYGGNYEGRYSSNYDNRSTYNSGSNYGGGQSYSGYGGGYNSGNYGQGQDYQRGRGGRVQGGWSQGGNQRGGYSRGRGWGERQY